MISKISADRLVIALGFKLPDDAYLSAFVSPADIDKLSLFTLSRILKVEQDQLALQIKQAAEQTGTAVEVTNFPATQDVSGTVSVSNFPSSQTISGAVTVSNFPATQAVTGTFFQATQPVSGTVIVTGVATEVTLSALNTKIPTLSASSSRLLVDGSQVNQPMYRVATVAQSFMASTSALTVAASATDIFTITGSGTKTIQIIRITITATRTTGAQTLVQLIRRSTANSSGTSSTLTAAKMDSNNSAATATVLAYTANPSLGNSAGTLSSANYFIAGTGTATTPIVLDFGNSLNQPVVLRGTGEVLAVNLNGVTVTGGSFNITVEWSEI